MPLTLSKHWSRRGHPVPGALPATIGLKPRRHPVIVGGGWQGPGSARGLSGYHGSPPLSDNGVLLREGRLADSSATAPHLHHLAEGH
jgi:hypothetical protein